MSLNADSEHLYFNIDDDECLDDREEIFMVDTHCSSLCEMFVGTISWDADLKKAELPDST